MVKNIVNVAFVLCATLTLAIPAPAQTFTTLYSFCSQVDNGTCTDGAQPAAGLVQATNGGLIGTTIQGGPGNGGTVFQINSGGTLSTLYVFSCTDINNAPSNCPGGAFPEGLVRATTGDLYGTTPTTVTYAQGGQPVGGWGSTVFEIGGGTTYTFCGPLSTPACTAYPSATTLTPAADGGVYGITLPRGMFYFDAGNDGTIFKLTPSGTLTTLYAFCTTYPDCTGGYNPSGLIQGSDGELYGTTTQGGSDNVECFGDCGTLFKLTADGTLTTLYSFCSQGECPDGAGPTAGLIQAANGDLYGTTVAGGNTSPECFTGCGTIFKITRGGTLTTLYTFCSQANCTDGAVPETGLIQASDGNFYGTTWAGGTAGFGTVFKLTPSGTLTTLHSFCSQGMIPPDCPDGTGPSRLMQATDGNFYGTTIGFSPNFGANGEGTVFSLSVGLGPFVETLTTSGKVGAAVHILGTDLTGATHVAFNGSDAKFKVVSATEITAAVPAGATTGIVTVQTPGGTLKSNVVYRVTL
jgi:uncharacterized repeat protein (TIGR03803 family)